MSYSDKRYIIGIDLGTTNSVVSFFLVPMLRVGMQGVALRADISKAKLVWLISVLFSSNQ